jgi:hypothetical protein
MFKTNPIGYGFYLLVPGMLCYYIFFLKLIPELFEAKKEIKSFFRLAFTLFAIMYVFYYGTVSYNTYKKRKLEVSTSRGTMFTFPRYYRIKQLLYYIEDNTEPTDSIVIFPDGLMLNFLSGRENPMYYFSFLPVDFLDPDYHKKVVRELEENDIKYAAIVSRFTGEYGADRFGTDYARDTMKYLKDNYNIKQQFGPFPFTTNKAGAVLLKKKRR